MIMGFFTIINTITLSFFLYYILKILGQILDELKAQNDQSNHKD